MGRSNSNKKITNYKRDLAEITQDLNKSFNKLNKHWPSLYKYLNTKTFILDNKTENSSDIQIKEGALEDLLIKMYLEYQTTPPPSCLFNAFDIKPQNIKVVLVGQDPYPSHHAHGYSFSSSENEWPASLKNIIKAIKIDFGENYQPVVNTPNLLPWVQQGVFLLNVKLNWCSKADFDLSFWEDFFIKTLEEIQKEKDNVVYILLGNDAKKYAKYIKKGKVISSVHPSPLSAYRGFFIDNVFKRCNDYLESTNQKPIKW